jgi:hypothetical protein
MLIFKYMKTIIKLLPSLSGAAMGYLSGKPNVSIKNWNNITLLDVGIIAASTIAPMVITATFGLTGTPAVILKGVVSAAMSHYLTNMTNTNASPQEKPLSSVPSPQKQIDLGAVTQNLFDTYKLNQFKVGQPNQTTRDAFMDKVNNEDLGAHVKELMNDDVFKEKLLLPLSPDNVNLMIPKDNVVAMTNYLRSIVSFADLVHAYRSKDENKNREISIEEKKSLMFHAFGCHYPFMRTLDSTIMNDTYITDALKYDKGEQNPVAFGFKYHANKIIDALQNNPITAIPKKAIIVDMFCGEGSVTNALRDKINNIDFFELYGFDANADNITLAMQKYPGGEESFFHSTTDKTYKHQDKANYMLAIAPPCGDMTTLMQAINNHTTDDAKIVVGLKYNEQNPEMIKEGIETLAKSNTQFDYKYEIIKPKGERLIGDALTSIIVINKTNKVFN